MSEEPATKSDIMRLAASTKTDFKRLGKALFELSRIVSSGFRRLDNKIDFLRENMNHRFDSVDERLITSESRVDRLITSTDFLVGKSHDNDRTAVLYGETLSSHRTRLENHDRRLGNLERPR